MRMQLTSWLSFVLWCCMYLSVYIFGVSSQCLDDQRTLLLQLQKKLTFNPANSTKLVTWNQSPDCCNWTGVSCDVEGRVTGLDLSGELISSGFDNTSSLFNLQNLQSLNLSNNNFSSAVPSGFNKLKNLTFLNLSYASFVGQIPMEISQLTRLVTLDISSFSYLTGKVLKLENPNLQKLVQNLTGIKKLYVDGASISAQGQEWCNALLAMPGLQELSMSHCNLSGPIDSSLATLQHLSVIRLDQNNFSSSVPEFFANFTNLTTLHLSNCGLSGIFPQKIFQVVTLTSIDISYNIGLHGSLPKFPLNGSLQMLVVSNTNFSGQFLNSISNLRQLSRLDLSKCQFDGTLPSSMSRLTELAYLDLSFNNLTGPIPSFNRARYLTHLDLSHNDLTGGILSAHLEGLLNLVYIDLRYNSFNGNIPPSLFSIPLLQKIQLSYNHFDGQLSEFSTSSALDTLDLSCNNLEGPVPMSIFNLSKLSFLQLASNKFNGSLQLDMFRSLGNLTSLDLSYNNLSFNADVMDADLSSFPNLTTILLASCNLSRFPEFLRHQSSLSYLDLSENHIQGMIPSWIWELDSLYHLNLSNNLLTGLGLGGPSKNLPANLLVIDLHSNLLQGQIQVFHEQVTYLDLSNNNFSSAIPPDVGTRMDFLIFLSLSNNSLGGSIPRFLCNASSLQVLDLSDNKFDGTIPGCLIEMEYLGVLNLRQNKLNGSIPDTFPKTCALQTLDLQGNQLGGPIPKSLANCMTLEVINLGKNQLVDRFPCLLKKISTLRVLVLRENKFQGSIGCPNTAGIWQMLQIVDLAFNKFSGKLSGKFLTTWEAMMLAKYQHVSQLEDIRFKVGLDIFYQDSVTVMYKGLQINLVKILTVFTSIDFSSNHFEGPIPEEMMKFKALYVLNLSKNALTGQIPSSIENLKQLESLDLSNNLLEGEIPIQLASLTFLSFLNLSSNYIAGPIPEEMMNFKALHVLNLSNNALSGQIPSSIGNLKQLESLDMSINSLSGNIPTEIASLSFLSFLNLSYNYLVGRIPTGGQLMTFDATSFQGNDKLCGTPLTEKCTPPPSEISNSNEDLDWNFLSAELGFVFGLGTVIVPLLYRKPWRLWYWNLVDNILCRIFPQLYLSMEYNRVQWYSTLRWRR